MAANTKGGTAGKSKGGADNAKRGIYTRSERLRLLAKTLVDERSLRKWERGEALRESVVLRLEQAARSLGLPVPERPVPQGG